MTTQQDDPENPTCLDDGDPEGCEGKVEYRLPLTDTGIPYPRCDKHWAARLDIQAGINERYPDSPIPPADFDPSYAGERWNEDD